MHVVVVGGTGLIGSRVVNRLRDHGVEVRVASLRTGVDAYSGHGLVESFEGAQVVVDVTNMNRPSYDYEQAVDFFETCTRNILAAEEQTRIQHHVGLSIVGAERIESNYFRGKAAQERLVSRSSTPHSVLRATLLYEFLPKLVEHAATTHLVRLPPVRVQPVAAEDVVSEVCRLALGVPLEGRFELAGPEEHFLDELARQVLASSGDTRTVTTDANAFYLGARLEPDADVLLPAWRRTDQTFTDWLSASAPRPDGALRHDAGLEAG
jgi:uncharacterized protein YbjT (DUF2867 family)